MARCDWCVHGHHTDCRRSRLTPADKEVRCTCECLEETA